MMYQSSFFLLIWHSSMLTLNTSTVSWRKILSSFFEFFFRWTFLKPLGFENLTFSAWYSLKSHTYSSKPAELKAVCIFRDLIIWVCVTFQWAPDTKGWKQVNCFYLSAQQLTFLLKDSFSKCSQIRWKLRILWHLLKKPLTKISIFVQSLVWYSLLVVLIKQRFIKNPVKPFNAWW